MIKYICDMCGKEIAKNHIYPVKRLDNITVEPIFAVKYESLAMDRTHICLGCRIKVLQEGEWVKE